jgi:hypothetical protein
MKKFITKNKKKIVIGMLSLLVVSNVYFLIKAANLRNDIIWQYQTVPDLALGYEMDFDAQGWAQGTIEGFVTFANSSDQPKTVRQYYVIKAHNNYSQYPEQSFTYDNIVKLGYVAPTSIGEEPLAIVMNNPNFIKLQDSDGNSFVIDKTLKTVMFKDSTGDTGTLTTDQYRFRDLMLKTLKK